MKKIIMVGIIPLFTVLTMVSCNTEVKDDYRTNKITGVYRLNNISWNGSNGPCVVNQIITITKTEADKVDVVGTCEIVSAPDNGIGTSVIAYVGDYSIPGCHLFYNELCNYVVISYSNFLVEENDLDGISSLHANLIGDNDLEFTVKRGKTLEATSPFRRQ